MVETSKDPNSTEVLRDYVREAMRYFQLASFCDMTLWKFCFLQVVRDFLNSGVSLRGYYIYMVFVYCLAHSILVQRS